MKTAIHHGLIGICLHALTPFGASAFSFHALQAQPVDSTVLASIADMVVTDDHVRNAFREAYFRTGQVLTPDEATRRAILDAEFNTYVLAVRARELGIEDEPETIMRRETIRRRVITEEYRDQVIHQGVSVTENEIRDYHLRFNTRLRASHLFSPTLAGITELQTRLEDGETFEALAAETFTNSVLASNGGDLGWFTTDEMDVAFEEAAFSLSIGQTSAPVRTAQGYSIIRLTDRAVVPLLTEQEFQSQKLKLESYILKRKRELRTRQHMETFIAELELDQDAISRLWQRSRGNILALFDMNSERTGLADDGDVVLVKRNGFRFTLDDWMMEARATPSSMTGGIRDRKTFEDFTKALAYREFMMEEAQAHGIPGQFHVNESIEETYRHHLAQEVVNRLKSSIQNSDDELKEEYLRDPSRFVLPLELNLQRIILRDERTAHSVRELALSGVDYSELVREHTIHGEERLLDGVLGYESVKSFGFNGPVLAGLQVGEISEVVAFTEAEYHLYKCLGREEAVQLTFDEAYTVVNDIVTEKKLQTLRRQTIEQTMLAHDAFIDVERLHELVIEIR